MQSRAAPVSSWVPKLTQLPKESTLTFRPERPRRRYDMVGVVMARTVAVRCPTGPSGRTGRARPRAPGACEDAAMSEPTPELVALVAELGATAAQLEACATDVELL